MTCYLCGHGEFDVREGEVRDNPALEIRQCRSCGLVSLSSAEHIQAGHYENSGMHGGTPMPLESWLADTDYDDQRRFGMLKPLLVNRRLLDFGCGAGGFLRKAAGMAATAVGVEPERRVREFWGSTLAIHPDLETAGGKYDLVTAFHVVEHLPDPRAQLAALANHLEEDGRLVVEVPSSDDTLLTLYESDAFRRFTYWSQHLFLFNPETLHRLATQAGLRVLAIEQYQRYPLSNHLYWLARRQPGGHRQWAFLDSPELTAAYTASLAAIGKCDTLIAHLEKA